jgi:hypothetical protein
MSCRHELVTHLNASRMQKGETHLVNVDDGLPLVVAEKVEVAHTNLSEVTGMVLVDVGPVVMLYNCQSNFVQIPKSLSYFVPDHRPYRDHRDACDVCPLALFRR